MNWTSNQSPLVAKPHCCEEASLSSSAYYIPCNAPAVSVVGWKGRGDKPIRMCVACQDHNLRNRNGEFIQPYWPEAQSANNCITEPKAWPTNPTPSNPLDAKSEDELLMLWNEKKKAIETAKAEEMDLRKYIVGRAFPQKSEGTNSKDLGNGYQLKAVVKYNYNLADNDTVESCLERISNLGNSGSFIADRLVGWTPAFKLTEYRQLVEDKAKGDRFADECLKIVNEMLTITDAAPTLNIVEPKAKKK